MSEQIIIKFLKGFKLTQRESEVYIFLAKNGVLKGVEIANGTQIPKAQTYRLLKSLQSKGMVQSTLEFPARFTAIPLERVWDLQIKEKREEIHLLEGTKNDVIEHWKSMSQRKNEPPLEKFTVIKGLSKVYSKIFQMIEDAEKEILVMISGFSLVETIDMGTDQTVFKKTKRSKIIVRLLTQASKENFEILKQNIERISQEHLENRIIGRHLTDSRLCTRFFIKDEKEVIFFITPSEASPMNTNQNCFCLWTSSKAVIDTLKAFFEELWLNSKDIREKLKEIETEKPAEISEEPRFFS